MIDEQNGNRQFLTFSLRQERFAVPVAQVREILEFTPLTRVPRMPAWIAGVINLRGRVAPVVDLRIKLGMEAGERTRHTCIVVLEVPCEGTITQVGALVDGVQEVIVLNREQIEPPPRLGVGIASELVTGMGKQGDRFIILLHVEKVFANQIDKPLASAPTSEDNAA